jgi:hypothetical protein
MRSRYKCCQICDQPQQVLFRVRQNSQQTWQFVCTRCLPGLKANNPAYEYGGTWKAQKKSK